MFHVTSYENALGILQSGVDASMLQASSSGFGFYLTPDEDGAEFWQDHLYQLPGMQSAILAVDVSGLKILTAAQTKEYLVPKSWKIVQSWAHSYGYMIDGEYAPGIAERHFPETPEGLPYTLLGMMLVKKGFADGYTVYSEVDDTETVVIVRPEKLSFSLYSESVEG